MRIITKLKDDKKEKANSIELYITVPCMTIPTIDLAYNYYDNSYESNFKEYVYCFRDKEEAKPILREFLFELSKYLNRNIGTFEIVGDVIF